MDNPFLGSFKEQDTRNAPVNYIMAKTPQLCRALPVLPGCEAAPQPFTAIPPASGTGLQLRHHLFAHLFGVAKHQ